MLVKMRRHQNMLQVMKMMLDTVRHETQCYWKSIWDQTIDLHLRSKIMTGLEVIDIVD